MRIRSLVVVALLVPVVVGAQRRGGSGRIGGGRVAPPASLPPQPGAIANEMRYVRLPISSESYMFISYFQNGAPNVGTNYGSLAAGDHLEYRISPKLSIAADITSTIFNVNPSSTIELGTRLRPFSLSDEAKVRPYVDARVGYQYANMSYAYSPDPTAVNPVTLRGQQFGRGFGAVAGIGSEFDVTRTLSLTTGLWQMQSRLRYFNSGSSQPFNSTSRSDVVSSTRLALGLKWNPVKAVRVD